ncbi:helix-turn-helix domain-containing protein, partial [Cupriavidus sp. SIMBA_020]
MAVTQEGRSSAGRPSGTRAPGNRQAGGTKARILDAAEDLFIEHGFEAMSMRQITSRAAVNLAAVNY